MQRQTDAISFAVGDECPLEPRDELRGSLYQPRHVTSRLLHMHRLIHGLPPRAELPGGLRGREASEASHIDVHTVETTATKPSSLRAWTQHRGSARRRPPDLAHLCPITCAAAQLINKLCNQP